MASSTMPSNKFWLLGVAVAAAKEAPTAAKALDSKELAGKPILEKVETSLAAVKPTAQFQPAKEILGAVKPPLSMMGDIEPFAKVGVKMRVEYKARDGKAAEMTWLAVSKAFVKMAGVDPSRVTVAAHRGRRRATNDRLPLRVSRLLPTRRPSMKLASRSWSRACARLEAPSTSGAVAAPASSARDGDVAPRAAPPR